MLNKIKDKKAVSPVVATVLLITISIIVIVIIFIWAQSAIKEGELKFGESISNACEDVSLSISIEGNNLAVINLGGRVALYSITLKGDSGTLYACDADQNLDPLELSPGEAGSIFVNSCLDKNGNNINFNEVKSVIPVVKTDDDIPYNCEKNEITNF